MKRLLSRDAVIDSLRSGLEKVSKECCDENTSCYNCLRNYYNQSYHNKLQRKLAIDVIRGLLFEIDGVIETYQNESWRLNSNLHLSNKKTESVLGGNGKDFENESVD